MFKKRSKYQVKTKVKKVDEERKKEITKEERFYWAKAITAVIAATLGILVFNLKGWWMFLYLACFMLIWPFIQNFVIFRHKYEKGIWDWKKILGKGIGAFFFTFMLISTALFTIQNYQQYNFTDRADTVDIATDGQVLFIADGENGFKILNTTNIYGPREVIASYIFPGERAISVQYKFNLTAIKTDKDNLYLFQVSNYTNPELSVTLNFENKLEDFQFFGDEILFSIRDEGIHLLNISNLDTIINTTTQVLLENSSKICFQQNQGIISTGNGSLILVNVSQLYSLDILTTYFLNMTVVDILIDNKIVYVATSDNGIQIFNISSNEIQKIANYTTLGNPQSITLSDDVLIIADGTKGVSLLNVVDPSNPKNMTITPHNTWNRRS